MNHNFHYEFWVGYYEALYTRTGSLTDTSLNDALLGAKWGPGTAEISAMGCAPFYMKVCYPGLLAGLGYSHSVGSQHKDNDVPEIALGFSLDYVTGSPYIPGSSVKGVIRSAFRNPEYIAECLNVDWSAAVIAKLETKIFGPLPKKHDNDPGGCDVFFSAYPVKVKNGRLFAMENITPHRGKEPEMDGLVDPTPINLMKVVPETVFQFRILAREDLTIDGCTLSAAARMELYRTILLDLGVGAKTNVGFGLLEAVDEAAAGTAPFHYLQVIPTQNAQPAQPAQNRDSQPAQPAQSAQPAQNRDNQRVQNRENQQNQAGRKTGIIKMFKADKGFGFIKCGDDDYFFHVSETNIPADQLTRGLQVSFLTKKTAKGNNAIRVEKA